MNRLALDETSGHVYERTDLVWWYPIWPTPILTPAKFTSISDSTDGLIGNPARPVPCWFREVAFDPVTRVRRGLFYLIEEGTQPCYDSTLPHPAYGAIGSKVMDGTGASGRRLFTYLPLGAPPCNPPYTTHSVVLGTDSARWRILTVETVSTGELLFTLKVRSTLGVLPELNLAAIPPTARKTADTVYSVLVDAAYHESPESVVDRARAASQWLLGAWLFATANDTSALTQDLGQLVTLLGNQGRDLLASAARVVARLHARKPNEQHARALRPLSEEDATLALSCVSFIVQEIGWDV